MKRAIILGLALSGILSACGVDGPPERPDAAISGVTVSGEALIGVKAGS